VAPVIFDSSGAVCGTTALGGAGKFGTVFKLSPPAGDGRRTEKILSLRRRRRWATAKRHCIWSRYQASGEHIELACEVSRLVQPHAQLAFAGGKYGLYGAVKNYVEMASHRTLIEEGLSGPTLGASTPVIGPRYPLLFDRW